MNYIWHFPVWAMVSFGWNLWPITQTIYDIMQILINSFCSSFDSNYSISSHFCTCHDSLAVMACAKLWTDLIIIFHMRAVNIFTRFVIWVRKSLVKWFPVTDISSYPYRPSAVMEAIDSVEIMDWYYILVEMINGVIQGYYIWPWLLNISLVCNLAMYFDEWDIYIFYNVSLFMRLLAEDCSIVNTPVADHFFSFRSIFGNNGHRVKEYTPNETLWDCASLILWTLCCTSNSSSCNNRNMFATWRPSTDHRCRTASGWGPMADHGRLLGTYQ